ncbi:MAG: hypothetical protein IH895_07285 [Planctomycetes bacterium]|nr:hypothetical protein [Planctomycetota bacterium]
MGRFSTRRFHVTAALLCSLCITRTLTAQDLRIFEDRFVALAEARKTCQPLVLHFYDSQTRSYVGGGEWISPQARIRVFYSAQPELRDKALKKAVVLLLPMSDWRGPAADLGVTSSEGLASLSPYELTQVDAAGKWGGLIFR